MCGILGWLSAERVSRETLVSLTNLMRHRGPDGSGCLLYQTRDGRFHVGLGHCRLSIIDVEGGAQPMVSKDGRFALIFNGEIYNYRELREELRRLGHLFYTTSDTEVLIESFRAWDLGAISRFRGMFAFALWDREEERLILARDAFGKKPLFLATPSGSLLFASEIEPLLQFPGVSRELSVEALGHYLLNRYVPGPLTLFRSITKLQPGHYAVWRNGETNLQRYFEPPLANITPDVTNFEEAVRLFDESFDDAVRIRMRSEVPFGAYLSGGIDSSAVVAAMVRHTSEPVKTFSVGFSEMSYSELDYARIVAEHFRTDHQELIVEPQSFMGQWPAAVQRRGAPVSEPSDIPILMLSGMASDSVKMVLTGEGADELLGGYPKHRAEQWVGLYQALMPQILHENVIQPLAHSLPADMHRIKTLVSAVGERRFEDRMRMWFGGASSKQREAILGVHGSSVPPDNSPFSLQDTSTLRRTLFFDQTSWLPDNLLERGDRMMMAGSIEGRLPFMDVILAGTIARFSDEILMGARGGKAVLRASMVKRLPGSILSRKKVGFKVPFGKWLRERYRDFAREMLLGNASIVTEICSQPTIRRLLEEHLEGRQNHERTLWSLLNLELFLRLVKQSHVGELMRDGTRSPIAPLVA